MAQTHAAHFDASMRRQQARRPGPPDQLATQAFARAMGARALVILERYHLPGDESADAITKIEQLTG